MTTFLGNPVTFTGKQLQVGDKALDFSLTTTDLSKKTLADFDGKKKGELVELKYDVKKLPAVLHAKKGEAASLKVTVQDVKQIVLPELNDEMIVKLFGKDAEVKTNAELRDYIKKEILKQKQEN